MSQALICFWKLYKLKDRKTKDSDAFDISMASCFPYADIIFTEKNMAKDIQDIKRMSLAYQNVKSIYTINDVWNMS